MLTIGTIIEGLEKEGKKPSSPSYSKAIKDKILFHFELDEESLGEDKTLENEAINIAKKCKVLYGNSSSSLKKMLSTKKDKVRQFLIDCSQCLKSDSDVSFHFHTKGKCIQ